MRRVNVLLIFFLILVRPGFTQDTLTNKTIISLGKAGLGQATIVAKIKTSVCMFNLQTNDLIELKNAGLSDEVIEAMINKGTGSVVTKSADGRDTVDILPSGIYYCKGKPCAYEELEPSVYSQANSGSGLLTSLTYGVAKTKSKAILSGSKSNFQIYDSVPSFYFYFDKSNTGIAGNQSSWFSTASSPNEFILVKFSISGNKKNREVVTGSWNTFQGMTSGIDDAYKVPFKFQKLGLGIYRVYFEQELPAGEYCFMYAGGATTYGGAASQKVYDFGVSIKKGF